MAYVKPLMEKKRFRTISPETGEEGREIVDGELYDHFDTYGRFCELYNGGFLHPCTECGEGDMVECELDQDTYTCSNKNCTYQIVIEKCVRVHLG